MAIPALSVLTGELPPGVHEATLDEVERTFGNSSERRKILMTGLRRVADNLEKAGVPSLWLDGSFTTSKNEPNDIDGCWEYNISVDHTLIDPVLLTRNDNAKGMKRKYWVDLFLAHHIERSTNLLFPDFFQRNKNGDLKGILLIRLGRP